MGRWRRKAGPVRFLAGASPAASPALSDELTLPDAIRIGIEFFQAGRLAEAERLFRQILVAVPDHALANHILGLIALAAGKLDVAAGLIGKAARAAPGEPAFANSLGEVHRAANRLDEAVACYAQALALNPRYAEALSNRSIALQALGRSEEALAGCDEALAVNPQFAEAWSNRGVMLQELGRLDEAVESFDRALALKPGFKDALGNRGSVLRDLGRLDEALAAFDRVLAARPGDLVALDGRGTVLQRMLRTDEARASYREALGQHPDFHLARVHEAILLLLTGEYAEGWKKYEFRARVYPSLARDFAKPAWLGDRDIAGKTVLLHAEQGLGETIQFARYVQSVLARGAKVVFEVQPPLKPLLRGIGASKVVAQGDPLPAFDFHCPLPSLPLAMETTLKNIPATVPYLAVEKLTVTTWKKKLARRGTRLVGLCWKGDPAYRNDRERSIRLAELQPLLDLPGLRFVSLQKDLDEDERSLVADRDNFGHPGANFKNTAEMVAALDLVITVDTAWAHWAGAIGKPVWVMLAHYPHWCWMLERQDSPWYPTARLFRQAKPGEWGPVLARVKRGLAAFGKRSGSTAALDGPTPRRLPRA